MYKHIKKFLKCLINIIIWSIIAITLIISYSIIEAKILDKPYTNILGYTIFEVATGSMSGTIEIGDAIIVKLQTEIQTGDIVVFEQDENLVTHRIIKITENNVITKGDANNTEDDPISRNNIIGKVVKIIPNIGIWKRVILTPKVFISIITTIILFGLAVSYRERKTDEKESIKNEQKSDK